MERTTNIDQACQSELAQRAVLLAARLGSTTHRQLALDVDQIRRMALQNGMLPAASIAQVLESALARGDTGPLIAGWIAILAESIGGDRHDGEARESYAAFCSVRLAG